MFIENTDARAVVRYFRAVNPAITDDIVSWNKGMPVELDKIHTYELKGKCMAIWMDFSDLNMSTERMEKILKRVSLLDCEFFMYHNNKRYRIGFRVKGVIK